MTEPSEPDDAARPQVVQRWLGVVGLFIAPTTIVTSLCFYFGYVFTRTYFAHFGVDADAIGYTTSDYVLKSVSVLYGPIIVLLVAWVALLWAGAYVGRLAKSGTRARLISRLAWVAIGIGGVALVAGLVGVAIPRLLPEQFAAVTPMALGMGTVCLVGGYWTLTTASTSAAPRTYASAERASLVVAGAVVLMALFWITNLFATAYGRNQAETRAAKLWTQESNVVLDTTARLATPTDLIAESVLPFGESAPKEGNGFRYQCFRELAVRGDRWVLVPARWTSGYGYALIVNGDAANHISLHRLEGIDQTQAADWNGDWRCPEVAPPDRLRTLRK